jgi:hypothetical protein
MSSRRPKGGTSVSPNRGYVRTDCMSSGRTIRGYEAPPLASSSIAFWSAFISFA